MKADNLVILTGNIGVNPEAYSSERLDTPIVTLRIAQNDYKKNEQTGDFEQSHTNWIDVKAFGNLAARALSELTKGDLVTVYGRLSTRTYAETGSEKTRKVVEVIADDVRLTSRISIKDMGAGDSPRETKKSMSVVGTR